MVQRMHHGPGTSEDEESSLALGKTTKEINQEKRNENTAKGHPERKALASCLGSPYIAQGKL